MDPSVIVALWASFICLVSGRSGTLPTGPPRPDPARQIAANAMGLNPPNLRFYSLPLTRRFLPWTTTVSAGTLLIGEIGYGTWRTNEPWAPKNWWQHFPFLVRMLRALGRFATLGPGCLIRIQCIPTPPTCHFFVMCPTAVKSREGHYTVNQTGVYIDFGSPVWTRVLRQPDVTEFVTNLTETQREWFLKVLDPMTERDTRDAAWVQVNRTDPDNVMCRVWSGGPLPVELQWDPVQPGGMIQSTATGRQRTNVTTWSRAPIGESTSDVYCNITSYRWNASVRLPYEGPPPNDLWWYIPPEEVDEGVLGYLKGLVNGTTGGVVGSPGFVIVAIFAVGCTIALAIALGRRRRPPTVVEPPSPALEMQPIAVIE